MPNKLSMSSPFSAMGETFDLMQKMWGGMGMPTPGSLGSIPGLPQQMPSMLAPTVDYCASTLATPAPMPREAPVTKATFPRSMS